MTRRYSGNLPGPGGPRRPSPVGVVQAVQANSDCYLYALAGDRLGEGAADAVK